jgi:hypothetical protein
LQNCGSRLPAGRWDCHTPALEVQPATVIDFDEAGQVILRGDRDRWGSTIATEDDDGAEEDSGEDSEGMAKLWGTHDQLLRLPRGANPNPFLARTAFTVSQMRITP